MFAIQHLAPRRAASRMPRRSFYGKPLGSHHLEPPKMPHQASSNIATEVKKIKKLLCANRGEIAVRVFRAATELGIRTVAVYSHEDRLHIHRYKAEEAYEIGQGKSPVAAYLDIPTIINIAKENDVDAIHPGYGFLSERSDFAKACQENGITFIGPTYQVLQQMGDKTASRKIAEACDVPIVPGTKNPISTVQEAKQFVEEVGYPIIIKAAMGGGGRGMRVVRKESELEDAINRAQSEALSAFGDATIFIERYVDRPRHIEVQILADATGDVVHLFERDCSIQRRHQKLIEIAPSVGLDASLKNQLYTDAKKIARYVKYKNAGTFEFLVDQEGRHYFIEVNPRIQVEHTVTEEITGVDLVQSQINIASGLTLKDMGLSQSTIESRGHAIQCRITSEDPENNFQPDTGRVEVFRPGEGMGIRLDSSSGFANIVISPFYDSLLSKVTAHALTWDAVIKKMYRALSEFRVRGVKTNIPFLQNVVKHPDFRDAKTHTNFIDVTPELFDFSYQQNRAQKLLYYLSHVVVNGPSVAGATGPPPSKVEPIIPPVDKHQQPQKGWRDVFLKEGPKGFAKKMRQHKGLLITDTTWRDAHQSLLATRMRTTDLAAIAPATAHMLPQLFSLENWGGATFDVALRFLHECPWERLITLRELVPNIPFQMLLRGANAVGYTAYADNVVYKFCKEATAHGMDIFRIFDSLNYLENMKLGIDAVGAAGGIIEAAICYTGDVSNPKEKKYHLDYYLNLVRELDKLGVHILGIKDMAGLLKPNAARKLISAIRKEFPDLPIHVHTHDTAGTGVASMLAAAESGADAVDVAIEAMSGLTSQPAMGAVVAALQGTNLDTGLKLENLMKLNDYWINVREIYAPFESGQKSAGADVYMHEMPGGQYTNLLFQAQSLGLAEQWPAIKQAYAEANELLGNIVKVTPSSKVVGDLAQFMVQNNLSGEQVVEQAATLSFPSSVVEYFQGFLGHPVDGFPEPLGSRVLRGKKPIQGRPGASLPPFDFDGHKEKLEKKFGKGSIKDVDVVSSALYPDVFEQFRRYTNMYSKGVSMLPTRYFLAPVAIGEEFSFELERGKTLWIKLLAKGELDKDGNRKVFWELNGLPRTIHVLDQKATTKKMEREKANSDLVGSVGAPMPGVIGVKVKKGDRVKIGDPLIVLSAMKMETVVSAPINGKVETVAVQLSDDVKGQDLLVSIIPE